MGMKVEAWVLGTKRVEGPTLRSIVKELVSSWEGCTEVSIGCIEDEAVEGWLFFIQKAENRKTRKGKGPRLVWRDTTVRFLNFVRFKDWVETERNTKEVVDEKDGGLE